jgi:hypothetical protein
MCRRRGKKKRNTRVKKKKYQYYNLYLYGQKAADLRSLMSSTILHKQWIKYMGCIFA